MGSEAPARATRGAARRPGSRDSSDDDRSVAKVLRKDWVIGGHRVGVLNVEAAGFGDYAYNGGGADVGQAFAKWVFAGPVPAGKRVADDNDVALGGVEKTAPGETQSEGGEKAGIDAVDEDFASAVDEAGTDVTPDREPSDGCALDAGHFSQAMEEVVEIVLGGGILVAVRMETG